MNKQTRRWSPLKIGVPLLLVTGTMSAGVLDAGGPATQSADEADWQAVVAAAESEGSVSIYSALDPTINEQMEKAFEAEHPAIDVSIVRLLTGDAIPRFEAEHAAGTPGADVLIVADWRWHAAYNETPGNFAPLVGPNVSSPELSAVSAPNAVGVHAYVYGYGWRTGSVEGEPTIQEIVADPEFNGRIATYDPEASDTARLMVNKWQELYGEEFLANLIASDPLIFSSGTAIAQSVAAGETDVAWPLLFPSVGELPIEMRYQEQPPTYLALATVVGGSPGENAGQVFVDWMLTPAGQEILARDSVSMITPAVESARFELADVHVFYTSDYTTEFIEQWREELIALWNA